MSEVTKYVVREVQINVIVISLFQILKKLCDGKGRQNTHFLVEIINNVADVATRRWH